MALLRVRCQAALLLLCAAVLALPGGMARAQSAAAEYDIKAAFLFNFTKFVDWPPEAFADARSPLKICVLGNDPFGKALRPLMNEEIGGRRLTLEHADALSNIAACHVLFVSRSERDRLPQFFAALRSAPVLTVGDVPGFVDQGGMINFILEGSKLRFDVNQEAAERVRIKISSKLLALAKHVKGAP